MEKKLLLALVINVLALTGCDEGDNNDVSEKSNVSTSINSYDINLSDDSFDDNAVVNTEPNVVNTKQSDANIKQDVENTKQQDNITNIVKLDTQKIVEPAQTTATATANLTEEQKAYQITQKVSNYIDATNQHSRRLSAGLSVWSDRVEKIKQGIENKNYRVIESSLLLNSRGYERLRQSLIATLTKNPIPIEPVDTHARNLIATLDELLPIWAELEKYNSTRRFEDDNGAKGKELMATFTPDYLKANQLYNQFSASVQQLAYEQSKLSLKLFKKQGRTLELYAEECLNYGEQILAQFDYLEDFQDKEKITKANEYLALLEDRLDKLQNELQIAEKNGRNIVGFSSMIRYLEDFIGDYRAIRNNPRAVTTYMVEHYNQAVECYNDRINQP